MNPIEMNEFLNMNYSIENSRNVNMSIRVRDSIMARLDILYNDLKGSIVNTIMLDKYDEKMPLKVSNSIFVRRGDKFQMEKRLDYIMYTTIREIDYRKRSLGVLLDNLNYSLEQSENIYFDNFNEIDADFIGPKNARIIRFDEHRHSRIVIEKTYDNEMDYINERFGNRMTENFIPMSYDEDDEEELLEHPSKNISIFENLLNYNINQYYDITNNLNLNCRIFAGHVADMSLRNKIIFYERIKNHLRLLDLLNGMHMGIQYHMQNNRPTQDSEDYYDAIKDNYIEFYETYETSYNNFINNQ